MELNEVSPTLEIIESLAWRARQLRSENQPWKHLQASLEPIMRRLQEFEAELSAEQIHRLWLARLCLELVPRHEHLHRDNIIARGWKYQGVYSPTKKDRNTHCWSCKRKIEGRDHLVCIRCQGVVCVCGNCVCTMS